MPPITVTVIAAPPRGAARGGVGGCLPGARPIRPGHPPGQPLGLQPAPRPPRPPLRPVQATASQAQPATIIADTIRLNGLPLYWSNRDVEGLCNPYGLVTKVDMSEPGAALVTFKMTIAAHKAATSVNGLRVPGGPGFIGCELWDTQRQRLRDAMVAKQRHANDKIAYVDEIFDYRGADDEKAREIFLRALPCQDCSEDELREWLTGFGQLESAVFLKMSASGVQGSASSTASASPPGDLTGHAYARFDSHADAAAVLKAFPLEDDQEETGNVQATWSLSERLEQGIEGTLQADALGALIGRLDRIRRATSCPSLTILGKGCRGRAALGGMHIEAHEGPHRFAWAPPRDGTGAPSAAQLRQHLEEVLLAVSKEVPERGKADASNGAALGGVELEVNARREEPATAGGADSKAIPHEKRKRGWSTEDAAPKAKPTVEKVIDSNPDGPAAAAGRQYPEGAKSGEQLRRTMDLPTRADKRTLEAGDGPAEVESKPQEKPATADAQQSHGGDSRRHRRAQIGPAGQQPVRPFPPPPPPGFRPPGYPWSWPLGHYGMWGAPFAQPALRGYGLVAPTIAPLQHPGPRGAAGHHRHLLQGQSPTGRSAPAAATSMVRRRKRRRHGSDAPVSEAREQRRRRRSPEASSESARSRAEARETRRKLPSDEGSAESSSTEAQQQRNPSQEDSTDGSSVEEFPVPHAAAKSKSKPQPRPQHKRVDLAREDRKEAAHLTDAQVRREIAKGRGLVKKGRVAWVQGSLGGANEFYVQGLQRILALPRSHPRVASQALQSKLARYVDEAEELQRQLAELGDPSCSEGVSGEDDRGGRRQSLSVDSERIRGTLGPSGSESRPRRLDSGDGASRGNYRDDSGRAKGPSKRMRAWEDEDAAADGRPRDRQVHQPMLRSRSRSDGHGSDAVPPREGSLSPGRVLDDVAEDRRIHLRERRHVKLRNAPPSDGGRSKHR